MRTSLLRYIVRLEYALASLLVMVLVWLMLIISDNLPEADETSFLDPILGRIDFLNIADVSLDAIFAVKDAEFPDSRIKVVNVGEVAPTPDGAIAMLLYKLHAAGARVIGIDIILDQQHIDRFPEDRLPEFDALVQALHDVPNVVVVSGFDKNTMKPDFMLDQRVLDAAPGQGFANLAPDPDGVVRRFLPQAMVAGERWFSLPVRMLQKYDPRTVEKVLRLPDDPQIIYYTATYKQFESVPIEDVIYSDRFDDGFFRDAIVLVGFVNEGGLFYLGDTHKTPMGRKIGVEGPDMPGILVHANVINMLLRGRFVVPIPVWADWLLVFLFSYFSIALYRVLRTKAPNSFHVGLLITTMLFTEAVIVFFLPLIAFFFFDLKISYNLMATAVVLFIPANAALTKLQFFIESRRMSRFTGKSEHGLPAVLHEAFSEDEPFVAQMRLIHACLCGVHFSWAQRIALRGAQGAAIPHGSMLPGLAQWREAIPALEADFASGTDIAVQRQYFLRYLDGRKHELLRESTVKELFFTTELSMFNEFMAFQEWELLLPYARRLLREQLRRDICLPLFAVEEGGGIVDVSGGGRSEIDAVTFRELCAGLYSTKQPESEVPLRLSPFCEWAECKVHREPELFIFAGMVKRQHALPTIPMYYGRGLTCEPVLPAWSIDELRTLESLE